jgi:diguanylate cyclase (GGDEF)-like protein
VLAVWQMPDLQRLGADQLRTVLQAAPAAIVCSTINAGIIAATLWHVVPAIGAWLLVFFLMAAWLYGRGSQNRKSDAAFLSSRAIRRAIVFAVITALPWATLPIAFLGVVPHQDELVLITVLAGMSGGGSVLLAPVYPAALAYSGLILLAFSVKCLFLVSSGYGLLGLLTVSYSAFLVALIATTARLSVERSEALRALTESTDLLAKREAMIRAQKVRFETALNNMTQGLCFFDGQQRMIVCNRRFIEMYGLDHSRVQPGVSLQEIVDMRNAVGAGPNMGKDAYLQWRSQVGCKTAPSSTIYELKNGNFVEIHYQPMTEGGWVATHDDITEKQKLQKRLAENHKLLEYVATHDCLTGLANRALFRQKLEEAVSAAEVGNGTVAVLMLDLNKFKPINDLLGHPAGDALLKLVARRLVGCVRTHDIVARLGGDEFAIVVHCETAMTEAVVVAERVRVSICGPFDLAGEVVNIGTSVGIAGLLPQDSDIDNLLRRADRALYRAKAQGGSCHKFDEPSWLCNSV